MRPIAAALRRPATPAIKSDTIWEFIKARFRRTQFFFFFPPMSQGYKRFCYIWTNTIVKLM